ncbi:MAG: glycosyl transferase [Planctomycetota bacterium]|nr:MAG: glycosyl transferase [Planctomycetota bacterium]
MRVLLIMECTIGGTRRHLRDLALGLSTRGHQVHVIAATLRDPGMLRDLDSFRAAGLGVTQLDMVRAITPLRDGVHALSLARRLPFRGYDVIHTHSSKAGALGRCVAPLFSRAARVHTPHTYAASFDGGKGQGGDAPGPPGLILATERVLGRVTDRLIHVSEAERDEGQALRVIPAARACVVPNGIDPDAFANPSGGDALRVEFDIPASAPLVGTVGLLNDAKGHDLLVEALAQLPDNAHALIVGHGELEAELRAQAASLGLGERLHITGWRDDVLACLDAMDVFCLPSRWEGMSYALLEAMSAGKACVSSQVNGSPEALTPHDAEAAGRVVPRGDATALAAVLRELLDDAALRTRFGQVAAARVRERFSLNAMLTNTLAVYEEARAR